MTRYPYFYILLLIIVLSSCQTIEQLSIDYMVPANISFPSVLKRVAIVNNVSDTPQNKMIVSSPKNDKPILNELSHAVTYYNGTPSITTESLAKELSDAKYFDEVVICDSALRSSDILPRESTLSKEEVQKLTKDLDVDFIISLENIQVKATKAIHFLPEWNLFQGTTDAKVYPTVKIYLPKRNGPMVTVSTSDSIFWEETGASESQVRNRMISDEELIKASSEFAGTIPVKYLAPYWKTANRFVYISGSIEMRDAAIYVREKAWNKALPLWEHAYQSKNEKQQMRSALNIALYYEMNDSIEEAEKWALKAQKSARKIENVDKKMKANLNADYMPNYFIISLYVGELQERKINLPKLNMQMNRFNNDF
ncbi:DUF6340 family protein [uncultured Bacteroides sp.]|uniref:DUF6340 family protein n=1 Tax=uncultured Bacteroides sp. TaxID=162156 RepID=UPI002AA9377E|nr:DUF6340 family protein [uncultured Bacteroides sp.]